MGYRVEVSHEDPEHHNYAPAHYGPAFGPQYADAVFHATGEYPDLLEHARRVAARFLQENTDPGWSARVVDLVEIETPEGEDRPFDAPTHRWQEVTP